ncbi:MAG: sulfatase-like hydrolase/transferase [Bacteroidota bacterium]
MRAILFIYLFFCISGLKENNNAGNIHPNVIILYTDDQRWNTIHALGNEEIKTPNMDRLVKMGTSFTRAHVLGGNHGAICAFSRAMLLTGKPFWHIPPSFANPTTGECPFPTMPEIFKENGYKTYFTGKWHNKAPELIAGFDEGKNIFMGGMHFPEKGGHFYPNLFDEIDKTGEFPANKKIQQNEFSSKLYADAAIHFINNHEGKNPFFIYTSFTSPHDPRTPPSPFDTMYDPDKITLPPNFAERHSFKLGIENIRDEVLLPYPRTEEEIRKEIALYYGMISEVDAQIGRILDALEQKGVIKNTVIVFAGDNGLAVGQHGLLGKQNLYDHSVRVPLIMAGPGIPENKTATSLCSIHDIYPTVADLCSISKPENMEGISLVPSFKNPTIDLRENILLAYTNTQRALKTADDWKIILTRHDMTERQQIFNLNKDPWEKINLIRFPSDSRKNGKMSFSIRKKIIELNDPFFAPKIKYAYGIEENPIAWIQYMGDDISVRYTDDGSEPNDQSLIYEEPLEITKNTTLKAKTYYKGQAISPAVAEEIKVINTNLKIDLLNEPAERYAGHGRFTLFDSKRGSENFHDQNWLGFHGEDVEMIVRFEEEKDFLEINIGYLHNPAAWIFPPQKIEVYIDQKPHQFKKIKEVAIDQGQNNSDKSGIKQIKIKCRSENIGRLKIQVKNIGTCPEWHDGKGQKAWLFLDEIWIE